MFVLVVRTKGTEIDSKEELDEKDKLEAQRLRTATLENLMKFHGILGEDTNSRKDGISSLLLRFKDPRCEIVNLDIDEEDIEDDENCYSCLSSKREAKLKHCAYCRRPVCNFCGGNKVYHTGHKKTIEVCNHCYTTSSRILPLGPEVFLLETKCGDELCRKIPGLEEQFKVRVSDEK